VATVICATGPLQNSPSPLNIGREFPFICCGVGTRNYNGVVDDARVYDRVLSDLEILALFSPASATEVLGSKVEGLRLARGIENSLTSKLHVAAAALDRGQKDAAVNILEGFINQVEALRGKKIASGDADGLVASAQAIIDSITG